MWRKMLDTNALQALGVITISPKRSAIMHSLGNPEVEKSFGEIKSSVEAALGRRITAGSLIWHLENTHAHGHSYLEKLKGIGVIKKNPESEMWYLTEFGAKIREIVETTLAKGLIEKRPQFS